MLKVSEHIVILGRNEHLEQLILQINAALGGRHYVLVVCEGADSIPVTGTDAVDGTLLKRLWAQTKLAELLIAPKRNEEEIVSLGKKHGLLTPYTSLIVLDSLEQYIEHRIPPPRSLPKMLHEYNQAVDTIAAQKKQEQRDKLKAVVAMWKASFVTRAMSSARVTR